MVNTEQPQTKASLKNQGNVSKVKETKKTEAPKVKTEVAKEKVAPLPTGMTSKDGGLGVPQNTELGKTKTEDKPETEIKEKKEEKKKQPIKKVKKEEVVINSKSVPISTKYSTSICKFIKGKRIGDAIRDLEEVTVLRKAVPMKGEIPHRKGKIMSGRFPKRAAKEFIVLLKGLAGNANNHEIDEPVITEAIANKASRPYGRFGRWQRKRTHITIKAREKKVKLKENKEKKEN